MPVYPIYENKNYKLNYAVHRPLNATQINILEDFSADIIKPICDELFNITPFVFKVKNGRRSIILNQLIQMADAATNESVPRKDFRTDYLSINFFIEDLKYIQLNSPKNFQAIRKRLRNQSHTNSWHGYRFEARTLKSFLRKGIAAKCREHPDFELYYNGASLFAEAVSPLVGLDAALRNTYAYKIKNAILKKNKKDYANQRTILLIDITNILHHSFGRPNLDDLSSAFEEIYNEESIKFGALLFFQVFMTNDHTNTRVSYETFWKRIDTGNCSSCLKLFLDEHYPFGHVEATPSQIPEHI